MPIDLSPLREPPFADVLQDLESLLSHSRLAFLLGAGCSLCAGLPLMDGLTNQVSASLADPCRSILNAIVANFDGAPRCTIEDYMSELVDLIALAERRRQRRVPNPGILLGANTYASEELAEALDEIKRAIARAISSPASGTTIDVHRMFIHAIHGTLKSGKGSAPKLAVEYFTLNYDTLLEDALALERIQLTDGFLGGATGWWNVELYDDPNVQARVYKLHGSIDWCLCDGDILPRRIRDSLRVPSRQDHLLIWPAATKYRETQRDPYAQLVSLMRRTLRPLSNTEIVLCICGYAFADEHINVEIDRALRESNERLTVVVFTSDDTPTGQLAQWLDDPSVNNRVRIHANRGFFHATDRRAATVDLPWWKFEGFTHLLAGKR